MNKSQIHIPEFFDRYINLVQEDKLLTAFENSISTLQNLDINHLKTIQRKNYAEGKWTVNEVFQHVLDFERILSYRALLFARDFPQAQPGIDENTLAKNSKANSREISDIVSELISARISSMTLFQSFDEEDMRKMGLNWKYEMSVAAMGFNLVGHQIHHLNILQERYWNL